VANLGAYQKISRVLPGQPFGNGADGAYSSATIPTLTKDSCSGTAASTTLTTSGSTFANGDVLLIHQSRGTGVGQWEINRVSSGGGSTSLTLQVALQYTYTDSGASQAQAIKIPQYTDVTVQTGTWTVPSWDQNTGGILVFAAKGTTTVTGTISASGKGFVGGAHNSDGSNAYCGEGTAGATAVQTARNGSGGGGGGLHTVGTYGASGGGGGNGAAGSNGVVNGRAPSSTYGVGGLESGAADLTSMTFGGAGGGAPDSDTGAGGNGGTGGGNIFIFTKAISISGTIVNAGLNGGDGARYSGAAGGGAGGSVLIACASGTLGSTKITASAGAGGNGYEELDADGGDGAVGRIAVHHSGTITGSSTPSLTDVTDTSLVETQGGAFLFNML
jgi:large repetitive protein